MVLHNCLFFVALSNVCLFTVLSHSLLCYLHKLVRLLTVTSVGDFNCCVGDEQLNRENGEQLEISVSGVGF